MDDEQLQGYINAIKQMPDRLPNNPFIDGSLGLTATLVRTYEALLEMGIEKRYFQNLEILKRLSSQFLREASEFTKRRTNGKENIATRTDRLAPEIISEKMLEESRKVIEDINEGRNIRDREREEAHEYYCRDDEADDADWWRK